MKTQRFTKVFAGMFLCLFIMSTSMFAQTLTTDQSDYAPGSTVILTGTGFASGETVTMQVLHDDETGGTDSIEAHQPWDIIADGDGNISTTWLVFADGDQGGASLIATADGQSSGSHAEALFTDTPNGTGVVTVTAIGGSCLGFTPAVGNGPDNWEVAEGSSYTMTITGVTECDGSAITIFIQNSNSGNFCLTATGGNGTYSAVFTVPNPTCNTMPVSYKCGGDQSCNNADTYNANGQSDNNKVHLRASVFNGNCEKTGEDDNCNIDCICTAPTGFTVDSLTPVSALLCWDPIACADGYIVAWKKHTSNKWLYRTVIAPEHCTTFTNNYPAVYDIAVATICDNGDTTDYTEVFIFNTYPSCLPPVNLYTDNILVTKATAHWTPGGDASKQNLWYRKVGDISWIIKNLPASATAYTLKNLSPGTSYEWQVRSTCSDDTRSVKGAFSGIQSFTTLATRLATDEQAASSLNIYPNPSTDGNFVIALNMNSLVDHASITITNLIGQVIYQQEATISDGILSQSVKLGAGVPFGTYMVRIIAAENVYTTQLVYRY